jgi:hypothetical protein
VSVQRSGRRSTGQQPGKSLQGSSDMALVAPQLTDVGQLPCNMCALWLLVVSGKQ